MANVTSLLAKAGSGVGFSFGVRAWTEVEIWCVKGMYRLKLISSEGFKVLTEVQYGVSNTAMHSMEQPSTQDCISEEIYHVLNTPVPSLIFGPCSLA